MWKQQLLFILKWNILCVVTNKSLSFPPLEHHPTPVLLKRFFAQRNIYNTSIHPRCFGSPWWTHPFHPFPYRQRTALRPIVGEFEVVGHQPKGWHSWVHLDTPKGPKPKPGLRSEVKIKHFLWWCLFWGWSDLELFAGFSGVMAMMLDYNDYCIYPQDQKQKWNG